MKSAPSTLSEIKPLKRQLTQLNNEQNRILKALGFPKDTRDPIGLGRLIKQLKKQIELCLSKEIKDAARRASKLESVEPTPKPQKKRARAAILPNTQGHVPAPDASESESNSGHCEGTTRKRKKTPTATPGTKTYHQKHTEAKMSRWAGINSEHPQKALLTRAVALDQKISALNTALGSFNALTDIVGSCLEQSQKQQETEQQTRIALQIAAEKAARQQDEEAEEDIELNEIAASMSRELTVTPISLSRNSRLSTYSFFRSSTEGDKGKQAIHDDLAEDNLSLFNDASAEDPATQAGGCSHTGKEPATPSPQELNWSSIDPGPAHLPSPRQFL